MNNNKVVKVVWFTAESCPPCKQYKHIFDRVSEMENFKDIKFETVSIEDGENHDVEIEKYGIKSIPTTMMLDKDNEPIYKIMGSIPEKDLIDLINEALKDR